jgi:hypothetical protein
MKSKRSLTRRRNKAVIRIVVDESLAKRLPPDHRRSSSSKLDDRHALAPKPRPGMRTTTLSGDIVDGIPE